MNALVLGLSSDIAEDHLVWKVGGVGDRWAKGGVSNSFLLLLVRHLLLEAMHLFLVASCYNLLFCTNYKHGGLLVPWNSRDPTSPPSLSGKVAAAVFR